MPMRPVLLGRPRWVSAVQVWPPLLVVQTLSPWAIRAVSGLVSQVDPGDTAVVDIYVRWNGALPDTGTMSAEIEKILDGSALPMLATRVAVSIEKVGKIVEISIDDNGVGFHFSGAFTLDELDLLRIGPVSLKRRARSLSAELLLESRPGQGSGLKMKIPI